MTVFAIVIACIFFLASLVLLPIRIIASPCCAFMGLLILSFTKTAQGYPLLPISSALIFGWLCVTVLVTVVTLLQEQALRNSNKGMGYIISGTIVGLAVGLLGFTFTSQVNLLYGIMILATAVGTFLGFMLYSNTPDGRPVHIRSGNFFRYLMAKGFPTTITVMQIGAVLVLIIALQNIFNP